MEITALKIFLDQRLKTKNEVETAANAVGISVATLYRYKANPDTMGIGVYNSLTTYLGLPLQDGAIWLKTDIIGGEKQRLALEKAVFDAKGNRFTTVSPYTVNSEIPQLTQLLLQFDYGTKAQQLEVELLEIRAKRAQLYDEAEYHSWEIWNAQGYMDFFFGKRRFKNIPASLRNVQIKKFIESTSHPKRHRFFSDSTELPMFGCYLPENVVLIRIDDIHLETRNPELVANFEETFNGLLSRCITKNTEQFVDYLSNPKL
jgi:hypothetical protein